MSDRVPTESRVYARPFVLWLVGSCLCVLSAPSVARSEDAARTDVSLVSAAARTPAPGTADARPQPSPRKLGAERVFPALGPLAIGGVTYQPYRFEGHVHSSHSPDARHGTQAILTEAERLGLDALVITDHGASLARLDFGAYRGQLTAFVGREIGGDFGHALMWNVAEDTLQVPARTTLKQRAEFAHAHGGLLVFAHPGWWIDGNARDPREWMTASALRRGGSAGDVDAIELWNGVYHQPLGQLIDAWLDVLEAGVFVPIVGNSDFHRFDSHRLGDAHNIALCDRPEIATCLWPAVREGRVLVTDGPAAVFSVNERPPGAIVDPAGRALRVSIEALAPEGGTLRVYLGRQVVQSLALSPNERATAHWEIDSPSQDSFVRIDIERPNRRPSEPAVSLLGNPVLIDVGPERSRWR